MSKLETFEDCVNAGYANIEDRASGKVRCLVDNGVYDKNNSCWHELFEILAEMIETKRKLEVLESLYADRFINSTSDKEETT